MTNAIPVPEWVAFVAGLGYWLRLNASGNARRTIATLVLPTRSAVALIAAFGGVLAGASEFEPDLDWTSLSKLPRGTEVFMADMGKAKKSKGTVVGIVRLENAPDKEFVQIKFPGVTRFISLDHLQKYRFTLQPLNKKARRILSAHESLYRAMVPECDGNWFLQNHSECLIAGEKLQLTDQSQRIFLDRQTSRAPRFTLAQLLGFESPAGSPQVKVSLASVRNIDAPLCPAPLCILDGRTALISAAHYIMSTEAKSVLVVLDRADFDTQAHDIISDWIAASGPVPQPPGDLLPTILPRGIECCVVNLPT